MRLRDQTISKHALLVVAVGDVVAAVACATSVVAIGAALDACLRCVCAFLSSAPKTPVRFRLLLCPLWPFELLSLVLLPLLWLRSSLSPLLSPLLPLPLSLWLASLKSLSPSPKVPLIEKAMVGRWVGGEYATSL